MSVSCILHSLSWRKVSYLLVPETTAMTGTWYCLPVHSVAFSLCFHVYSTVRAISRFQPLIYYQSY